MYYHVKYHCTCSSAHHLKLKPFLLNSGISSIFGSSKPKPTSPYLKDPTLMTAQAIRCCVPAQRGAGDQMGLSHQAGVKLLKQEIEMGRKQQILLQPRLCTLRSYGEDRLSVLRKTVVDCGGERREMTESTFMEKLFEYIESSNKSHEVEILSGRLAMVVFAATVGMEMATGNSVFKKVDMQGMVEAAGVCLGAVALAATFAWFSGARNQVGRIFTIRCNSFIDALIDQIVDGLFYESEISDWSDDV